MTLAVVVLAAGEGKRMNSDLPKVLHRLAGAPLVWHPLRTAAALEPARLIVVTGHGAEAVEAAVAAAAPEARSVRQGPERGTAAAVRAALPALAEFDGDVLVLYGDTPLLRPETLAAMVAARADHDIVVLGFEAEVPAGYGRLLMQGESLAAIIEDAEASPEERSITLCNSGVLCTSVALLRELLPGVRNANRKGEFYLTDIVALARARGGSAGVIRCPEEETRGVNTPGELAAAERIFQARARAEAAAAGVAMPAPETVIFAYDTAVGGGATVGPYVVFGPGVTVESGAEIRPFCHLEGCHVSRGAVVGPFARLRPGAELAEDAQVGNFVEVKNALIGAGAKANHLAYLGDAEVGARANIGAGTVTCNYDGVSKHRTVVGPAAFVGSDTLLVAPVRVGAGAMTAAGSVITTDVPDGALAVARARQEVKPGFATRFFARLRAARAAREAG